jgi:Family of unknown function (DUF6644)
MSDFAPWLADSSLSLAIRKAAWLIPTIQIVHIVAITMIMTSAAMIAARIVGFASQTQSMAQTGRRFLPWIWTGLVLLAPSGVLLIIAEPERTLGNPVFWWKMAFLAIVVAATFWFQTSLRTDPMRWEGPARKTGLIRVFAVSSVLLWVGVLVAGRWIAYTY